MNYYTRLSIELATQRDYLDQLFKVYPLAPDTIRSINETLWDNIEDSYRQNYNDRLIRTLLKLKLFPVKDSYVSFLRHDKDAIERNPQTVNRICGRIKELGLEKLYERITEPKEPNRQIGPLFRRWIYSGALGLNPVAEKTFLSNNDNAILSGSDSILKKFAAEKLNFKRDDDKGFDLICRFNQKYVIGESKFITDEGGHQNGQFQDALKILKIHSKPNIIKIAILDGVLYIPGKKKMYNAITSENINVMSALLLRNFLYSL